MNDAVVTVHAYFSDYKHQATKDAEPIEELNGIEEKVTDHDGTRIA